MIQDIEIVMNSLGTNGLAISLGITACVVSLWILFLSHRKAQKMSQKLLRLERELQVAQGSAIGMGQQLIKLEKQLNQKPAIGLDNRRVEQEPRQAVTKTGIDNDGDSIYNQAREALSQGLSVAEVAKQCKLSFAEVSLLQSLSKSTIPSC